MMEFELSSAHRTWLKPGEATEKPRKDLRYDIHHRIGQRRVGLLKYQANVLALSQEAESKMVQVPDYDDTARMRADTPMPGCDGHDYDGVGRSFDDDDMGDFGKDPEGDFEMGSSDSTSHESDDGLHGSSLHVPPVSNLEISHSSFDSSPGILNSPSSSLNSPDSLLNSSFVSDIGNTPSENGVEMSSFQQSRNDFDIYPDSGSESHSDASSEAASDTSNDASPEISTRNSPNSSPRTSLTLSRSSTPRKSLEVLSPWLRRKCVLVDDKGPPERGFLVKRTTTLRKQAGAHLEWKRRVLLETPLLNYISHGIIEQYPSLEWIQALTKAEHNVANAQAQCHVVEARNARRCRRVANGRGAPRFEQVRFQHERFIPARRSLIVHSTTMETWEKGATGDPFGDWLVFAGDQAERGYAPSGETW